MAEKKTKSTTTRKAKPTKEQKEKIKQEALKMQAELARKKEIHDEILSVVIIAVGVFLAVSLHTTTTGAIGLAVQKVIFGLFGKIGWALPYYLIIYGILNFAQKTSYITWRSVLFCCILFFLVSTFYATFFPLMSAVSWTAVKSIFTAGTKEGGIVGSLVYALLNGLVGKTGTYIVCGAGIIICLLFVINTPVSAMFDKIKIKAAAKREATAAAMAEMEEKAKQVEVKDIQDEIDQKARIDSLKSIEANKQADEMDLPKLKIADEAAQEEAAEKTFQEAFAGFDSFDGVSKDETVYDISDNRQNILSYVTDDSLFAGRTKNSGYGLDGEIPEKSESTEPDYINIDNPNEIKVNLSPMEPMGADAIKAKLMPDENYNVRKQGAKYKYPPLSLLNKAKASGRNDNSGLEDLSKLLEETMANFGVNAKVVDVTKGPSVTRFEVQPAPGVKVSSISKLHDDIMLNLRAKSLRIEAPIPGKAAVGIEVSNEDTTSVTLREILESKEFTGAKSKISMGLGKNIAGQCVVADLKSMPHLLIAGSTGSGKSVCINSIIMSILYKATPEEVKLILIDPKIVELSVYNGVPHLLIPVVTEPSKAAAALGWAVTEMDERYKKFEKEGVRELSSYNETVRANNEPENALPQIVIIIDEMADLMEVAQNQIESYISRLAAKARAAGIHLIFATQRPSVNVISGTIKNNIPSRIALAVSSQTDSRTILDMGGAEHLIGKGDMLFAPQNLPKPVRVQGCFVSDEEIEKVIEFVKTNAGTAEYSEDVNRALSKTGASTQGGDEDDEIMGEVIEFVAGADTVSVSSIQRRFRIGYNRAARLIDELEERGIVGPADGSHPRKVLLTQAEYESTKAKMKEAEE